MEDNHNQTGKASSFSPNALAMTDACTEYYFSPSILSNQFLPNVSFYHVVLEQKHITRCSGTVASSYIDVSVGVSSLDVGVQ